MSATGRLAFAKATELFKAISLNWIALVFLCVLLLNMEVRAQTFGPPDVVKLPAGLDLGGSSFFDGFGRTDPGFVFLDFARWNNLTSIKDNSGKNSPLFISPHVDALSNLFHIVYVTPLTIGDGSFTVEALIPVVGFDSKFDPGGLVLRDNGWNIGDLTFGFDYQTKAIPFDDGSILSWRAGVDFTAPTGAFDKTRDLNQSAGFWSMVPYLAVTFLPIPKWETSIRINYDYNVTTSRAGDVPPVPGFTFQDGQAGQAAWVNFATSYDLFGGVRPGINGYWLHQLSNDRTNGLVVPSARVDELYLGPGISWQVSPQHVANFNVYVPVSVFNSPAGLQFNIQNVVRF